MKLIFVYTPVQDLKASLALYRDELGFEEAWREGDTVAGLTLPGVDVHMMLEEDPAEVGKPGPIFEVDSVDDFYAARRDRLAFTVMPHDIPPGRYAAFDDASGNRIRILDTSKEH
ncbi:MAG: VOC family protein [Trueperaceae bacterium]|nr:VOC family protein [Trueperaceae bacterium]